MNALPALVVAAPLFGALLVPALALKWPGAVRTVALAVLAGAALVSAAALAQSVAQGPLIHRLGGWDPPWGIVLVVDPLAGTIATLVAAVAFAVAIYAGDAAVTGPLGPRTPGFYTLFLLLTAALLGMAVTGDAFNLYVFLEISALSAYGLVALGGDRGALAAFRYLVVGTIAASFYLLGLGLLYGLTGTLNMADLHAHAGPVLQTRAGMVGIALIAAGLATKAALFPLHGWLPEAYRRAPPVVTAFISAVMAKVSAYALYRVLHFVTAGSPAAAGALQALGWTAALALVAASVLALRQRDLSRMLAYSSVVQMGAILIGLAVGNAAALSGALLHVINHALMKGTLFLAAGGVLSRTGARNVEELSGLGRRMPFTSAAITVAALSMIGIPPTAGFFSKYYLLSGAFDAGAYAFAAALIASSLVSAVYFFRVIERIWFAAPPEPAARAELPVPMLAPVLAFAAALLVLGPLSERVVSLLLRLALPPGVAG